MLRIYHFFVIKRYRTPSSVNYFHTLMEGHNIVHNILVYWRKMRAKKVHLDR